MSTATAAHSSYLKQIFGMPERALKLYIADNSGCFEEPNLSTAVKPQNRVDHIMHKAIRRFLSGPGLDPLFNRFTDNVIGRLQGLEIGNEWIELEDLWGFFKSKITSAAIEAVCGPNSDRS